MKKSNRRKTTQRSITHTDEEGWTTTSPGKTKPKTNNSNKSSIESIITTIDGNIDQFETGAYNRVQVTSPRRKHKCNIPDGRQSVEEMEFETQTIMANGTEKEKEQNKKDTQEKGKTASNEDTNTNNNNEESEGRKNDEGNDGNNEGQSNRKNKNNERHENL